MATCFFCESTSIRYHLPRPICGECYDLISAGKPAKKPQASEETTHPDQADGPDLIKPA